MKCPKCHYLSFEPESRCRNCGHDLALGEADLSMVRAESASPLADLSLRPSQGGEPGPLAQAPLAPSHRDRRERRGRNGTATAMVVPPGRPVTKVTRTPDPAPVSELLAAAAAPAASVATVVIEHPRRASGDAASVTTELPLFVQGLPEVLLHAVVVGTAVDEPMVKVPAEPRVPLSVRRRAPDSGQQHKAGPAGTSSKPSPFDRDLLEDLQRIEQSERREAAAEDGEIEPYPTDRAGAASRLGAAAVDVLFLGSIGTAILWVTLRWLGLPVTDARILPWIPTLLFLLLMAAAYLLIFTVAGGQTIGKMLLGLRVVGHEASGEDVVLTVKQAAYRSLLAIPSVLAFGAGFIPALVGEERALHDRLAHTRVVRA
jgi:uncharacterized RDD family membrane protein YckC